LKKFLLILILTFFLLSCGGDKAKSNTCVADNECPTGQFCDTKNHECYERECVVNEDCPGSKVCERYRCVEGTTTLPDTNPVPDKDTNPSTEPDEDIDPKQDIDNIPDTIEQESDSSADEDEVIIIDTESLPDEDMHNPDITTDVIPDESQDEDISEPDTLPDETQDTDEQPDHDEIVKPVIRKTFLTNGEKVESLNGNIKAIIFINDIGNNNIIKGVVR